MVNKVFMIARLTRDPEVHDTARGGKLVNLRVVTTDYKKSEDGQRRDEVQYHSVIALGRTGESCAEYLTKGRLVWVEGKLQTREWEGKDGLRRYTTEILADVVRFLGSKPADDEAAEAIEAAGILAGAGAS